MGRCRRGLATKFAAKPAQAALTQAIRIDPRIPDAYVELANAAYMQQNYQGTVAVLDQMQKTATNVKETPWSTVGDVY